MTTRKLKSILDRVVFGGIAHLWRRVTLEETRLARMKKRSIAAADKLLYLL